MKTLSRPSPNFNARPPGVAVDCVVLHADASHSASGTLSWICTRQPNPKDRVSYHYLVDRDGTVYQCVDDWKRAWHAGVSVYQGRADVNDFSLGVSFANAQQGEPFPKRQLEAGIQLVADRCLVHRITPLRITTHAAVAIPVGRKKDPGAQFPTADFITRVAALVAAGGFLP